jgi:SprT protein
MLTMILRYILAMTPERRVKVNRRRGNQCQCDPFLESQARELLKPYAPALAERVHVYWNPRLRTTAGLAFYHYDEVFLNPALKNISEAEIEKTLRHELAHLLARDRSRQKQIAPHGKEWRQACIDLGIPKEKTTHQLPFTRSKQQRNFFYRCPRCDQRLNRVRKPLRDIACLSCCRKYAQGKYDKRFRYQLIDQEK